MEKSDFDAVNELYDAKRKLRLDELEAAYQRNLADIEASKGALEPSYQKAQNELSTAYEREKHNMNERMNASGVNNGATAQLALTARGEFQRDNATLLAGKMAAEREADGKALTLKQRYSDDVRAAIAENDYQKASALADEYKKSYDKALKRAESLAGYGDFSGFEEVYGKETADGMKRAWVAKNPELAYNLGTIDAQEYWRLTGKQGR